MLKSQLKLSAIFMMSTFKREKLWQGSEGGHWQLTVSADSEEGSCGRVWECGHRIKITKNNIMLCVMETAVFCDPTCIGWCFKLNKCNEGERRIAKKHLQCSFWMLDAVSCYAKDVTQIRFRLCFRGKWIYTIAMAHVEAWKILQFSTGFLRTHLKLLSLAN